MDTRANNRILADGEKSTPGGGGTVLIPDEKVLKLWKRAARRVLGGASLDAIGAEHGDGLAAAGEDGEHRHAE